jgi:hypothetical protein
MIAITAMTSPAILLPLTGRGWPVLSNFEEEKVGSGKR